ncbi:MAG: histidine--tRNA ligase [Planctomycetota bacterium]
MAGGGSIQAPRGTRDIFGEEFERLERLERLCANTAGIWGYSGIRTPVFEHTGLFTRSIGEITDIVEKEMFTIPRRTEKEGADSFTLRPENTAGVVRAYLEHSLHKTQGLTKLCYVGPQFRREQPQEGRYRQFHQMGVEILGLKKSVSAADYAAYAEAMLLAAEILDRAGLKGLKLRYNSVGCKAEGCRDGYRQSLKSGLSSRLEELCGDCRKRIDRNIFRVLDCKKPNCRAVCESLLQEVPQKFCDGCERQRAVVSEQLNQLKPADVEIISDTFLVRGLDYYTGTVFECVAGGLGAQDAVGGGGSYDGLIEDLGGPSLGATGFALGLERVLLSLAESKTSVPEPPTVGPMVYVASAVAAATSGPTLNQFGLAVKLRQKGIRTEFDLAGRRLKAQLKQANRLGARLAVIIGEEEEARGEANLKDMETREERRVKQSDLAAEIWKAIG